jgi:sugar/nucleoside kinase (ribokinase family)
MKYDLITIGDVMRDIFVFPALDEMEKPVNRSSVAQNVKHTPGDKFLLLELGDKIDITDIHHDIGGTAGNVAVGAAKMGLKTSVISMIGHDRDGDEIIQALGKNKVDTSHLIVSREKKTSFSIIISVEAERSILVFHSFKPADIELPKNLNTDWIFVGPLGKDYKSFYTKMTALAAEKNINIALNPGSVQLNDGLAAFGGLLRVTKILFVNKEEGQKLAGISGVANIRDITTVLKKTGVPIIVITDGKEGAYAATEDDFFKIGPYPGHRVEATGAGDAFTSAFMAGYLHGEKLFTCLQYGVTNSASVIEKVGAQAGLLDLVKVKRQIATYRWPASTLRFS